MERMRKRRVSEPGEGLNESRYEALKEQLMAATPVLSRDQLLDLADALHAVIRLRRPGRAVSDVADWIAPERRSFN